MRSRCCVQILVSHEINSTQLYSNQWCIHPDKYRYKPVMIWCLDSALNFMETRWLSHHFGKMPTTEQAKKTSIHAKKIHPSVRPSILLVPTSLNPRNKLIPNVHAVTTIRFIRISRSQQHNFSNRGNNEYETGMSQLRPVHTQGLETSHLIHRFGCATACLSFSRHGSVFHFPLTNNRGLFGCQS